MNPATKKFEAYYDNTFTLTFRFKKENGDAIDVANIYDTIEFIIFKKGSEDSPLRSFTVGSGITISDTNLISLEVTDEQNKELSDKILYHKLNVTFGNDRETFVDGRYVVNNLNGSQNDGDYTLTVGQDNMDVTLALTEAGVANATAIQARIDAETARDEAEQAAAGVNLPSIASGDSDKFLQVKDDESGYELKANVTLTTATDVSGNAWVLDEDDFASDSNTKVPTQQSAKKYVDDKASLLQSNIDSGDANLQSEIDAISEAQDAGVIGYEDKSTMDADNSQSAQTLALVTNDTTTSNNGWYRYDGTDWIATDFTTNVTNINEAFADEGETFEVV